MPDNNYPILWPEVCEVRSSPTRRTDQPQKPKRWPEVLRFSVIAGLMAAAWFGMFVALELLTGRLDLAIVGASGAVFFAGGVLDKEEETHGQ